MVFLHTLNLVRIFKDAANPLQCIEFLKVFSNLNRGEVAKCNGAPVNEHRAISLIGSILVPNFQGYKP
jgi:hypothetical protein